MRRILFLLLLVAMGPGLAAQDLSDEQTYGYLYCHQSEHGGWMAYALSQDGIHFHDLLCGDSVFAEAGGVPKDAFWAEPSGAPYICRAQDGGFVLVSQTARGIELFRSADLLKWRWAASLQLPGNCEVGDPKILWDASAGEYLVYFLMRHPIEAPETGLYGIRADANLKEWAKLELLSAEGDLGRENRLQQAVASLNGSHPATFRLAGTPGWQVGYLVQDGNPLERYRVATADEDLAELRRPQILEGVYGPGPGSFLRLSEAEYTRLQAWSDAAEPKHLAPDVNNPVFPGLHADPEVLYSEQTGKYYIYPTTDGAFGWHNHDFKCFSSSDLVHWKDEGVILDLQDLDWGKEYAWAPCIIERKEGRGYKYYYYFVANKSVGVAVADRPEGPFRDAIGGPLLSQEAIGSPNQVIDPDVFQDPATGKYYLYFGNSYMWMAELADDMVSLVPGTMHELIPRSRIGEYHYLEGTYVFERGGLYYFMWSENITRSARYRIRYLISDSPTEFVRNGQPAKVEDTIVLQQDPSLQIFGAGHHSVICKPGTDEWYIVYHRFTRPEGIKMGLSGGYNREVCIDRMYFNEDGTIVPVKVTL